MINGWKIRAHHIRYIIIPVLALILAHLLSYGKLPFDSDYRFPRNIFLVVLFVGFVVCETNRFNFRRLNSKRSLESNPLKNGLIHVASNLLVTTLVFTTITLGVNFLFFSAVPTPTRMLTYLFVSLLISLSETMVFISWDLYKIAKRQKQLREQGIQDKKTSVCIHSGKAKIVLAINDIAYFYSNNGMVCIVLNSGKRIVTNYTSLPEVETKLGIQGFFRINRQYLVDIKAVKQVIGDINRKLKVRLHPPIVGTSDHLVVSRYRSPEFKKWIATSTK